MYINNSVAFVTGANRGLVLLRQGPAGGPRPQGLRGRWDPDAPAFVALSPVASTSKVRGPRRCSAGGSASGGSCSSFRSDIPTSLRTASNLARLERRCAGKAGAPYEKDC
jgi:hypothetical protein